MTKNGRVEVDRTPSIVSGERATDIVDSEPVVAGEQPADPGLAKLASALGHDRQDGKLNTIPGVR